MIAHESLTPEIENALSVSMQGENEYFKKAIETQTCQLWQLDYKTYFISRVEVTNNIKTFVVCCYEGLRVCRFTEYLIKFCKKTKITYIRFHTRNLKLGRVMMNRYNFLNVEKNDKEHIYILEV